MAYKNLSQFIEVLESEGELIRVNEKVSPRFEMTDIADRLVKSGGKAVLFENNGTDFPVLINAMGTEKRMCLALGVRDLDDVGKEIEDVMKHVMTRRVSIWDKLKLLPSLAEVSSWFPSHKPGRGECQDIINYTPDLGALPVLTCWPYDGGPFITLPVVHTQDPENGIRNVGMYRMQVFDKLSSGMHWHLHKNSARHYYAYKRLKRKMPVTVTLGGDPVYTYVASAPMPDNMDEYLLAGFLRKKKVNLVKCITNDLEVPEDVDIVIEGYVDPDEELRLEGPFGDHTGFYSLPDVYPVFHVNCITHRKRAVYPATVVGIPPQEDFYMGRATERIFLTPIRMTVVPEIRDIHMPESGVFHNLVITNINKTYPGQAFKVMNALWGAGQMMFNKVLIVISDTAEKIGTDKESYYKLFARIIKAFDPARDVFFSKGPVDVLDHASAAFATGGKLGIDATSLPPDPGRVDELYRIVPVTKTRPGQIREMAKEMAVSGRLEGVRLLVFIEEFIDPEDYKTIVWRVLNNIDPERDCEVMYKSDSPFLFVDGTRKFLALDGFKRPWPNCTVMDPDTIAKVDRTWEKSGLGLLIPSPSLKYKDQVYPGGAEAE